MLGQTTEKKLVRKRKAGHETFFTAIGKPYTLFSVSAKVPIYYEFVCSFNKLIKLLWSYIINEGKIEIVIVSST